MNISELTERRERILRNRDGEDSEATADAEPETATCGKTPGCPRKARHTGRCASAEKLSRSSANPPETRRAANAARMREARASNKSYGRAAKDKQAAKLAPNSSSRRAQETRAATETQGAGDVKVKFFIEYTDNEVEVKLRGDSMAKLLGAMEMIAKIRQ